jgi:hypothetical protein
MALRLLKHPQTKYSDEYSDTLGSPAMTNGCVTQIRRYPGGCIRFAHERRDARTKLRQGLQ